MTIVYLALGSNVGDSHAHITRAIELLGSKLTDTKPAPLYASKAVGYTDQADFINTAVGGQTNLSPQELLAFVKDIEQQIGRIQRFRWGPREIDIDIIFYDDLVLETEQLTIPHASFRERDFVLQPLNDLNPTLKDPVSGLSVNTLLANLKSDGTSIIRRLE
jgi:2-amino-4-hydroxy-6-hydroxymethyldihydropteridine diphosphokinase